MIYAEVSVNSPAAQRRTFTYAVPPALSVAVGQAVWVPFGDRVLQGIILELSATSPIETRDIIDVIEPRPLLSPPHVALARWISEYYLSPLFDAVALMLPPGFERSAMTFVQPAGKEPDLPSLSVDQQKVFESVLREGKTRLSSLEKATGKKKAQAAVSHLVRAGLLARSYELEPIRVRPRLIPYLRLIADAGSARDLVAGLKKKGARKQAALLDFLAQKAGPVPLAEARETVKCDKAVIDRLVSKGWVGLEQVEVRREPISGRNIAPFPPLTLNAAQASACQAISDALRGTGDGRTFLLHGVTGSGKTEVYLQSLAEAVRMGKRGIVLVPEISLTPQIIERFAARFPHRVAVLHSRLSLGEQYDEWQRIRNGEVDVVIGPRSALFAPQPDLALIVIDEEHEWTYKQDTSPRYHTRSAALKLAELTGAVVVMGSATPDVETYLHAQHGDHRLLTLPERVVPTQGAPLPEVEIVDMREELKAGNRSIFSNSLAAATTRAVAAGGQVIFFLNRRGGATFVQCRNCGFVLRCKRCDVALSYHTADNILTCHHCNYHTPVPTICPRCRSPRIKFFGLGTQKLEEEAGFAFPGTRHLRWDSDTTQVHSHEEMLDRFRDREADILIGTQMVAKGLDLPSVTLVGVISADTGLNLPDFRAGERTFQLLSQVAGRAGRGVQGGKVVIQTYSPEHYAIQAAAKHDYLAFYNKEIAYRRQLHYPPFSQLALLVYSHANNAACQKEAERLRDQLAAERDTKGVADLTFIGPAPAFVHKLRGRFRWELILRGSGLSAFLSPVSLRNGWAIDIDPVSVI